MWFIVENWQLDIKSDLELLHRIWAGGHFNMDDINLQFFHAWQLPSMALIDIFAFSLCQWMTKPSWILLSCSLNCTLDLVFHSFKRLLFSLFSLSFRPFHVEPTNIVSENDDMQRVTDEASAMNKRIHYYSRLTSPADRALVRQRQDLINWVASCLLGLTPGFI